MAIGDIDNFTIYDEEFWTGVTETLQQNVSVFNDASMNTMRMATDFKIGQYDKTTFLQEIASGGIARRDPTVTTTVSDTATSQGEHVGVKLNRRIGPFADTIDKWKKIGDTPETFSLLLGQQYGVGIMVEQANTIIRCLVAAILNNSSVVQDNTGDFVDNVNHKGLAQALYKFGDQADRIRAWVMHSASARDLLIGSIDNQTNNFQVAGLAVIQGSIATLGKPVVVTDSAALVNSGVYRVLGLTENAGLLELSEERTVWLDRVLGLENLVLRLQGEYAYNVKLRGYSWDTTNGGVNPTDNALATGSNWDKVAADDKNTAGVALVVNEGADISS